MTGRPLSRRTFLTLAGAAPLLPALGRAATTPRARVPVGLEMYTLHKEEAADRVATLRAVAKMGYEGVEFWGPYFEWTPAYAKEVKAQLDALGLACFSTHTRAAYYTDENFPHVIELNQILGSRYVVMDHAPEKPTLAGWRENVALLTKAYERLRPLGIGAALHNWTTEWRLLEGRRPIDLLAAETPPGFAFQIDLGTCLGEGADPVAFIEANPGRVKSYHLKDSSKDKTKRGLLLGEGDAPWAHIFAAAETVGGVEYYLVEQEGSRFTPLETAKRSLEIFRRLHGT